uniref:Reverse transcriptase domain-containing protein n=1 Tax=Lactuca sativa TaxID=4236 RepID=A0A9R1UR21_LACSA|nr:hypothetical protein LSAT_V11C800414360 [Lactuca sativa]
MLLGSAFCQNSAYYFNEFIHSIGLLEIKMGGRRFTYMNSTGDKHSKLDRFLVSLNAIEAWPNLNVTAMPRVHSNHCAILLSASQLDFGPTPFKLYNSWLKDPDFEGILRRGWGISSNPRHQLLLSPLSLVAGKLRKLKEHIKAWRKEVTEKARKEMEELTNRINDIDHLVEQGLINKELLISRQTAYQKIMEIESRRIEDLKQKSRTTWALEGDENSAFFHGMINKHQRSQRINGTKENGFWINDPVAIKELAFKHFAGRFTEPINRALNSSALNLRNYPPPHAMKHFEASGYIDKGCNSSFIILVPKVQDPITINDFRPISLIGCLYKIISKVLAERLKKVVHLVVSSAQTTFIKNRNILDGPLILNEFISWVKRNKKKAFTFKVDFEKAFDSLSWEFLDSVMLQMEFGVKWRSWIRGCLSSTRVSVIINGSATKEFDMERGLRQGDPLSPFLFIIAAEGLHAAMESAKEKGIFKGIQLPGHDPVISHLQYADDVIFMGTWLLENTKNLIRILRCFELSSGLKINMEKCKLYGLGVQNCELELVARTFNCTIDSFPFTYLGLPVGASMARVTHWKPIIERFQAKLSRWKASTLSFGGRLTLCKAVLSSLGTFYFSIYKAPVKDSEEVFLGWLHGIKKNGLDCLGKNIAAKERGGMGVGSLKVQNLALLGKWWCRFRNQPDSTWALELKAIHGPDGGISHPLATKRRSGCWGSIACLPLSLEKDHVPFLNYLQQVVNADGSSKWTWSLESSGVYTVSSMRSHIDNLVLPIVVIYGCGTHWSQVSSTNVCKLCHEAPESEEHIFVGCPISNPSPSSCRELLDCKNRLYGHHRPKELHEAIMLVFMWVIWRFRNSKAHALNSNSNSISKAVLAYEVQAYSHLWINAWNYGRGEGTS